MAAVSVDMRHEEGIAYRIEFCSKSRSLKSQYPKQHYKSTPEISADFISG